MKVITWNCNMAFRKKAHLLSKYQPDIVIIQECEHPDKLLHMEGEAIPNDMLWYGTNLNKGLGVFAYGDYQLKLQHNHNPEIKTILPITVNGGAIDFTLYAIWASGSVVREERYIGQIWKAIRYYDHQISGEKVMLIGDFNSNSIWDKEHRFGSHSSLVDEFSRRNIFSVYHNYFEMEQGKEDHPTLYMYRHKNKPYHIDYCFASADLIAKVKHVEIGNYEDWCKFSDHKPLIIDFGL